MKHGLPPPRSDRVMTIGTDCSGLDVPVLAMKALGLRVEHAFSSEVVDWKWEFIRLNSSPKTAIFENMLLRDRESLPRCDIYCCGFSCKPFSSLHTRSRLFREREAKVFFETLRTIRAMRPPVAILENVEGIRKVMPRVLKELKGAGSYAIVVCHIDPRDGGEPVSRPRTYFVLVRLDLLIVPRDKLLEIAADALGNGAAEQNTARLQIVDGDAGCAAGGVETDRWLECESCRHIGSLRGRSGCAGLAASEHRRVTVQGQVSFHRLRPDHHPGCQDRHRQQAPVAPPNGDAVSERSSSGRVDVAVFFRGPAFPGHGRQRDALHVGLVLSRSKATPPSASIIEPAPPVTQGRPRHEIPR